MQPESGQDHSYLLCELAAILAFLASVPALPAQTATEPASDQAPSETKQAANVSRQPLTYDMVHGSNRLSLGGFPSTRLTWLDDERYLVRETTGWQVVNAATGDKTEWYNKAALQTALQDIPDVTEADARQMAAGAWIDSLDPKRIVVFQHHDQLIRITLDATEPAIVKGVPAEIELHSLSPTGSAMAFVRDNELWVADFSSGKLRQLTHDGGPHVRNGKADWVYFEEIYNRKWKAYRWSPDGQRLAYQQFNDTHVPTFQISDHTTVVQSFEVEHYPKAGETNPEVRLGVVSVSGGETTWIDTSAYPADDFILTHFQWRPDSQSLHWYGQNRIQTWLDVSVADVNDGASRKLLRDQTAAWIENPGDVTFFRDGSFLMFSERTGWRHLYRVAADGESMTPLTFGEWEVRDLHSVSADEMYAVVSGTKDSPIAENIYRVALYRPSAEVQRLSKEDGMHAASVSLHGTYFADSWSSLTQPTTVVLRDNQANDLRVLEEPIEVPTDRYQFGHVEFRDLPMSDGSTTKAVFILPPDFDESKVYPVWLKTYAGPHAPSVKNSWNSRLPDHLLANLGIVVITFDPRSASGKGAKSAWLAYRQLGVEETKDLLSVCDWLDSQSWVDSKRIGLSGHSYGGYFTAYAMTHTSRIAAGIAGAPVTDWAHYDTIYTERFMSTPALNPDGYRKSSVIAAASQLTGRLLLLHGLKDDNVHPENTLQLVHTLQQANKQFELMLYPTSRHGIYGSHYNKLLFNFMVDAMGKPEARQP